MLEALIHVYWRVSPEHLPICVKNGLTCLNCVGVDKMSDADLIRKGLVGAGYTVDIIVRGEEKVGA